LCHSDGIVVLFKFGANLSTTTTLMAVSDMLMYILKVPSLFRETKRNHRSNKTKSYRGIAKESKRYFFIVDGNKSNDVNGFKTFRRQQPINHYLSKLVSENEYVFQTFLAMFIKKSRNHQKTSRFKHFIHPNYCAR
jgi:hypothetical protein